MPLLKNKTIWITRPAHQASSWIQAIESAGGKAISVPTIEIQPVPSEKLRPVLQSLSKFHKAIFVSSNAVRAVMPLRTGRGGSPSLQWFAIGQATAQTLQKYGISGVIYPHPENNSEALLALPELQHIKGQKIVIFRGDKGRELLSETLVQRGAHVKCVKTYSRTPAKISHQHWRTLWKNHPPDFILTTSGEILQNLYQMVPKTLQNSLIQTPLVVVSLRMQEIAQKLKFRHIMNARNSSVEDCIAAIRGFRI